MNELESTFELCKEVYKRFPDWGLHIVNGEIASYREDLRFYKNSGLDSDEVTIGNEPVYDIRYIYPVPLYTSDYLLEKLPKTIVGEYGDLETLELSTRQGEYREGFMAYYADRDIEPVKFEGVSDTPLKALLKLTLALQEAGELK